jgi:uncharacterized membrane protein YjgN (DUF898 family)
MTTANPFQTVQPVYAATIDLPQASVQPEKFAFTGSGSEYFRIWIVNLLLTIVTLGIYSAWAKVRRTRYFYHSAQVAGSSFDYHGSPISILKGRIVVVLFFVAYTLALSYSEPLGLTALAVLVLLAPWLLWKSLQFKLYNSSYRGIRFGFRGTIGRVYRVYLLFPLMSVLSVYLLTPFAHRQMKKFQHEESRYGNTHFSFHATVGSFYKAYLICFFIMLASVALIVMGFRSWLKAVSFMDLGSIGGTFVVSLLALYVAMFAAYPIFLTLLQNLIWNNTKLGQHQFKSEMRAGKLIFIAFTNLIGIVLTLGLFIPFAQIRAMKYRIESMTLIPNSSLDNFIADTQTQASATGEGMADLLDFDLSL